MSELSAFGVFNSRPMCELLLLDLHGRTPARRLGEQCREAKALWVSAGVSTRGEGGERDVQTVSEWSGFNAGGRGSDSE